MKRTPMYDRHIEMSGKIVEFAGYELPIQYSSIMKEHMAVRNSVGIFDVSHMGDLLVSGPDAEGFLLHVLTNSVAKHKDGDCIYTHIANENGLIIDDMILVKFSKDEYFCVPNASMADTIFEWFKKNATANVKIENKSHDYVCIAVQGPNALKTIAAASGQKLDHIKFFKSGVFDLSNGRIVGPSTEPRLDLDGQCLLTRTGYTGEDGFEIIAHNADGLHLWDAVMTAGKEHGIQPIGLGARDTLRLEKGFLLSGTDFNMDRTTLETGWDFAIDWNHDFIGRKAMELQKDAAYEKLSGMKLLDKGVPRHGCRILREGREVGTVTSGTMSPVLMSGIAMGYLHKEDRQPETKLEIEIHGKPHPAEVIKLPFVQAKK